MSADTLSADGAAVALPPASSGSPAVTYTTISGANEVAVAYQEGGNIEVTGYDLDGTQVFSGVGAGSGPGIGLQAFSLAPAGGAGFIMTWTLEGSGGAGLSYWSSYDLISPSGQTQAGNTIQNAYGMTAFGAMNGSHLEWNATGPNSNGEPSTYTYSAEDVGAGGTASGMTAGQTGSSPEELLPYANTGAGSVSLQVTDNHLLWVSNTQREGLPIPGEPAHAITEDAAALLADGQNAAVAWVDSGTDYVAIFNSYTDTFGPVIGLDWGGASDLHVVALNDGGFAVSWMNGGAYKGEVFDGGGAGGGIISLAGDVAGVTSSGDLYTVGLNDSGQYVVQDYAINGGGGSSGGGSGATVYTSAASYTAPDGVSTIHLTGSNQTVSANNAGDTIWSDNSQNTLAGGTGNDTFHLGRAGDVVSGGGGDNTFDFAELPWGGGQITDFHSGDVLDLSGLMATTGDTGSDGFADGYLKITDSSGGAEVWAQYAASGSSSGWWLVETLDGVAASSVTGSGDTVTVNPAPGQTSVSTSDSNYVAASNVTSITLTGSQQHIDASATNGADITSNNTGNTLLGGAGADTFHLGRGGDAVTGGGGADTFSFAETPWAGATISDFNGNEGDAVDVAGLLAKSGYTGSDPFADGYLQLTSDTHGNAQLWSDLHQSGNDGWWLVTTMDGVSTSSLHYSGGLIT